jgi:uncharacterized protein
MKAYDEVYTTPGAFSWTELTTAQPAAAQAFYGKLFGWSFQTMPMPGGQAYTIIKTGDTMIGGMMAPPPDAGPLPTMWGPYITVASADETAKTCLALGGTVLAGPMDIAGTGRFVVLQDPQGAVFNAMAYEAPAA